MSKWIYHKVFWGWENVEIAGGMQIPHPLFPVTDTKSYSDLLQSNFGAGGGGNEKKNLKNSVT